MQRSVRQTRRATVIKVKSTLNFQSQTKISSFDVSAQNWSLSEMRVNYLLNNLLGEICTRRGFFVQEMCLNLWLLKKASPCFTWGGTLWEGAGRLPLWPTSLAHQSLSSQTGWHLLTAKATASESHHVYSGPPEPTQGGVVILWRVPHWGYKCFIAGQKWWFGGKM